MADHHHATAFGRVASHDSQFAVRVHPVRLRYRETVAHRAPVTVFLDLATGVVHDRPDPGQIALERIQRLELLGPRRGDFAVVTKAIIQALR
ncbi:hypothetical protein D3C77_688350 [compost metagenome]